MAEKSQNPNLAKTSFTKSIVDEYNSRLVSKPESTKMIYCVREPIFNKVFATTEIRQVVDKVKIRCRSAEGSIVIDGSHIYEFNDGDDAKFSIYAEDSLRTVEIEE